MSEIRDLQALINEKARRRAEGDYKEFCNKIENDKFAQRLKYKSKDDGNEHWFAPQFLSTLPDANKVFNKDEAMNQLTKEYIEMESVDLLNKIDSIQDYLDNRGEG